MKTYQDCVLERYRSLPKETIDKWGSVETLERLLKDAEFKNLFVEAAEAYKDQFITSPQPVAPNQLKIE